MDKNTAISKIKKCLALSKSANQNEAATALRQAHALMSKFSIDDREMLAAEATISRSKSGVKQTPTAWECGLAVAIANGFGCDYIFERGFSNSSWAFIGCHSASEIAKYAFDVLLRQLKHERKAFIDLNCRRLKRSSKTVRADLYCMGWVASIHDQVRDFAAMPTNKSAIAACKELTYGQLSTLEARDINKGKGLRAKDFDAISAGRIAGRNARLNHGVGAEEKLAIGGCA